MQRDFYLLAYDIAADDRRRRALRIALDYARDRQLSVFECPLGTGERETLLARLSDVIDEGEDRVLLLRADSRDCWHRGPQLFAVDHLAYLG